MKISRKLVKRSAIAVLAIGSYPIFVLIYTWSHVAGSDLKGGRHGPLDAYRHTLASAVVAYTTHERVVDIATYILEGSGRDSDAMDIHNNKIGAAIGSQAASFFDLESAVRKKVEEGGVYASSHNQITWLNEDRWRDGWAW